MPDTGLPLTVFHMLERNVGRRIVAILDTSYGFEGKLVAVTRQPPGIWLSDADAIILRSTIAQPIPQVVKREARYLSILTPFTASKFYTEASSYDVVLFLNGKRLKH